jgi:hypothetical protein
LNGEEELLVGRLVAERLCLSGQKPGIVDAELLARVQAEIARLDRTETDTNAALEEISLVQGFALARNVRVEDVGKMRLRIADDLDRLA